MNSNQKSVDYLQQDFRNDRVDIKHSVQTKLHELITSSAEQRQVREINNSNLIILGGLISFQNACYSVGIFSCLFTSHSQSPHNVPEEKSSVKQSFIRAVCPYNHLIAVHLSRKRRNCVEILSLTLVITRYDSWELIAI